MVASDMDLVRKAAVQSTKNLRMDTHHDAVQHMLPVVGPPQIFQPLQQGIPDTQFSPTPKLDKGLVPFAIALIHPPSGGSLCTKHSVSPWGYKRLSPA